MKVVAGLGNPGRRYAGTPHNVGFEALDKLAARLDCRLRRSLRFRARIGQAAWRDERLLLLKPQTYMNLSGDAIAAVLRYRKLSPSDVIVLVDDANLDAGRMRVRSGGSSGGHRGLVSVIERLGSQDFARVRIGVGRSRGSDLVDHVLSPFPGLDRERVEPMLMRAVDAVLCIVADGPDAAMNKYNGASGVDDGRE